MNLSGLNKKEVNQRIKNNQVNFEIKPPTKTVKEIVFQNIFTLFNVINVILLCLILFASMLEQSTFKEIIGDILFAIVIPANVAIGIFQEIKAKVKIDKLKIITKNTTIVIRDSEKVEISIFDIVVGDTIFCTSGDQIPVDGEVISTNYLEIDESLLTGESDSIKKDVGSEILSGSFVSSGSGYFLVTKVANDTYAAKISNEAKSASKTNSDLLNAINAILKYISIFIVPLSLLLFWRQISHGNETIGAAIISSSSGIIGMIPEGLVLLTTVALATSIVKLTKHQTLVQELPSVESLAHVNMLCLDKTGTLTEGKLSVTKIIHNINEEESLNILNKFIYSFETSNETNNAIRDYFKVPSNDKYKETIEFSSKRKWSAVSDEKSTYILGAPEYVLLGAKTKFDLDIAKNLEKGYRVLVFGKQKKMKDEKITSDFTVISFLLIKDVIRKSAKSTLEYFKNQGVQIKIISGDNPITVSNIAREVGISEYKNYIDAENLVGISDKEFEDIVKKTTIFGRVKPEQKKQIIKTLKKLGHHVAMTGDGVNDTLALKESDCGIAMNSGSQAAKSVSQIILVDSDFSHLPKVIEEGRRVINNIQKVASLYLIKTTYSVLLTVLFIFWSKSYPFHPIHLTVISNFAVGIPTFFLSFFPNNNLVSKSFLNKVFKIAIPLGIIVTLNVGITYLLYGNVSNKLVHTIVFISTGFIQLVALSILASKYNAGKLLIVSASWIAFICTFIFFKHNLKIESIFNLSPMNWLSLIIPALIALLITYKVNKE